MPSRNAIKLDLITPSIGSRLNGTKIDAPSVRVTEREGSGQPIPIHQETAGLEDPATCRYGIHIYDKVKIIVLSCLTAQERVDSPAPVDPGLHPGGLKLVEHG